MYKQVEKMKRAGTDLYNLSLYFFASLKIQITTKKNCKTEISNKTDKLCFLTRSRGSIDLEAWMNWKERGGPTREEGGEMESCDGGKDGHERGELRREGFLFFPFSQIAYKGGFGEGVKSEGRRCGWTKRREELGERQTRLYFSYFFSNDA